MLKLEGFELIEKLYESGKILVYRARDENDIAVVVKIVRDEYPEFRDIGRLENEYHILANLDIDGIVKCYSLKDFGHRKAIILEDFDGISLSEYRGQKVLTLQDVLSIGIKLSRVLGELHRQNIIHRDIKPGNVLINPRSMEIRITDFSIATRFWGGDDEPVHPAHFEGTLTYMSPEQTGRMNRSVDFRTDLYSLGVTLYRLLVGVLPFDNMDSLELLHSIITSPMVPPHDIRKDIPIMLSNIIIRLCAKMAEDRYQSAYGLMKDLEECKRQLKQKGRIDLFEPGKCDIIGSLQISEKLYGRSAEFGFLSEVFYKVAEGERMAVFLEGLAGIGKSFLAKEIQQLLVEKKVSFLNGKFEILEQNTPYSSILKAFGLFLRHLFSGDDKMIANWKKDIQEALGESGQLFIDLLPEIGFFLDEKILPVPDLTIGESRERFHFLFLNLIKLFIRKAPPLVLFLDDLQWADSASLEILLLILNDQGPGPFLFIGSFRGDALSESLFLQNFFDKLDETGFNYDRILLEPLGEEAIRDLLADTLASQSKRTEELAHAVMKYTGGNPFYVKQYITNLYREKYLYFDYGWNWDTERILRKGAVCTIVEFLLDSIKRLPPDSQAVLQTASCIGDVFEPAIIARLTMMTEQQIITCCDNAIGDGFLVRIQKGYKFSHDRVAEVLYESIIPDRRIEIHYGLGKLMLFSVEHEQHKFSLFNVVSQLNRSSDIISEQGIRMLVAGLDLKASIKAKESGAYETAFQLIGQALNFFPVDVWDCEYELALSSYTEACEMGYLIGEHEQAEKFYGIVLQNARTGLDKARVYETRIIIQSSNQQSVEAMQTGFEAFASLGFSMPPKAGKFTTIRELMRVKLMLRNRTVEDLIDLPDLDDPWQIAVARILMACTSPAFIAVPKYFPIIVLKLLKLSLLRGNSSYAAYAYAAYSVLLCGALNDTDQGHRFGVLALDILEKYRGESIQTKIYFVFAAMVNHWKKHYRDNIEYLIGGFRKGLEIGDIQYSAYCINHLMYHYFFLENTLEKIKEKCYHYYEQYRKWKLRAPLKIFELFLEMVINLQGQGVSTVLIKGDIIDEEAVLAEWVETNQYSDLGVYGVQKLFLLFFYGEYKEGIEIAEWTNQYLDNIMSTVWVPRYYFYYSLSLAGHYLDVPGRLRRRYLRRIRSFQKKMKKWASASPGNYEHLYLLVEAELFRIQGKLERAVRLFERAIKSSRKSGFIQDEALALELAGNCFFHENMKESGFRFIVHAHSLFSQWGGKAKVQALERKYSGLQERVRDKYRGAETGAASGSESSYSTSVSNLDLKTVMKASLEISEEIVLERLVKNMLRIMIENAGAIKGVLIIKRDGNLVIDAFLNSDEDRSGYLLSMPLEESEIVPHSLISYVERTGDSLVMDNASIEKLFLDDPYIERNQPRSLLCMPIVHHNEVKAILYLENNLVTGAFTPAHQETLRFLASQAAISLENALLYENLSQEMSIRKLAEEALSMYRHIVSSSSDQMSFVSLDLTFQAVNEQFIKDFAQKRSDIIGQHVSVILGEQVFDDSFRKNFDRCSNGEELSFEKWILYPLSGKRYMDISLYPFLGADGKVSGVIMNLRDSTEKILLEKDIIGAQINERQRIGMELHDGLSHYLLGIAIKSRVLASRLDGDAHQDAKDAFQIEDQVNKAIEDTRRIARGLSPVKIEEYSLVQIIEENKKELEEKHSISCVLDIDSTITLSDDTILTHIYYIIQEAVVNIIRHSGAKNVQFKLYLKNGIVLEISDDGIGMQYPENRTRGVGLQFMEYRVRIIGAGLEIYSGKGAGTKIHITLQG